MTDELLPAGAYLAWRYVDAHRAIDRRQVYYDDGRVEAVDNDERWLLCRLAPDQVAAAKAAIADSGLPAAADVTAEGAHDTAPVTYAWRLDGDEGQVTNAGYPAVGHPEIARLDAALADLEEAAGGWPLYADDDR